MQPYICYRTDRKASSSDSGTYGRSIGTVCFTCNSTWFMGRIQKNTWIDNAISGLSYIGMSIPSFWLGMVLIIVFAAKMHILPSSGMHTVGENSIIDTIRHMILPCITLSLSNLAVFIRYIRSNTMGNWGRNMYWQRKQKAQLGESY